MKIRPIIPAPYAPLLDESVRKVVEESGRSAGKSTTNETIAACLMMQDGANNVWYCRAERNDIRASVFASMLATIDALGLSEFFKSSISPMEITCKATGAKCYFGAVNGKTADDLNATKGFTPQGRTLALFIVDEANEVKSPMHLKAAESTAEKFLLPGSKIIYAYNPPPVRTHWAHRFFAAEVAAGAVKIYATYKDIAALLKPATLQAIEEMRRTNERQFRYWYLGEMVSLQGLVLYTFERERNLVPFSMLQQMARTGYTPQYIIYGVDSGVVKDPTAVCAWAVMPDCTLLKLATYYIDPRKEGVPIPNTEQVRLMKEWYVSFYTRFRALGIPLPGAYHECWVFDSAVVTQDLMLEWRTATGFHSIAVENKSIDRDIKRLQNGYFRGIFRVLDCPENAESLREIEGFVYDEDNDIPDGQDDHTIDADKYATAHFYYGYMASQGP